jgi:hypothetical protein
MPQQVRVFSVGTSRRSQDCFATTKQDKACHDEPVVSPALTERLKDAAHHRPSKRAERETLLAEGKEAKAMVWSITPVEGQPGMIHLRVEAHFADGQRIRFEKDLPSLYQPEPDSPDGVRGPRATPAPAAQARRSDAEAAAREDFGIEGNGPLRRVRP